ncbi:MAG: phage tail tape measure protein [Blautia massiliensis (ex Durand et al. 2017)]|uniref:phage tail tape measure protein n=1 Tax=Blautia massiliensis (ex Durand et al. 2017) TaxID=1737424 RepID=UPI00204877F4|nr:MAG TPA: minor tail protein [Caudoviricetes sp.]
MAAKKIGAIIALDGEKEFRSAVTDCEKTLKTLRSEMNYVTEEAKGQEDSMESLQKVHEVMAKVLNESKNKQEAINDALEHAKESYNKVGDGLETLRKDYEKATQALEDMKDSSSTTQSELEEQEKTVQELAEAISKGEKNYQTAGNRVKDWEKKLNDAKTEVLKLSRQLDENEESMRRAASATDECSDSLDDFSDNAQETVSVTKDIGEIVKENLVNTAVDALKELAAQAEETVEEIEDATQHFEASTGTSAQSMKEFSKEIKDLYGNNYGDSLGTVADDMAKVKQYMGETDPSKISDITENAIALEDVFGMDFQESIRGVDALMGSMGLTADEAFDYIAKGAQNGLDKSGELVDNLAEYAPLWAQQGFSAQEMFSILQNGLETGAYNLDKVNDFVKEFGISLNDGRMSDNLTHFSNDTKAIFTAFQSGKATSKQVFDSVVNDLANATNQQEALTLASNMWSALGEDNSLEMIKSLNKVNDTYEDVYGTMNSIKDIQYDSLSNKWDELGRKFQLEIADPIEDKFLPVAKDGIDMLIDHMDLAVPAISSVGAALATLKIASVFGAALTPVGLLTTALAAGSAAVISYGDSCGEVSGKIQKIVDANSGLVESAKRTTDSVDNTISNYGNSLSEIEAKGQYAQTLADRIGKLATETGRSNEETEVMKDYITELNDLIPDLNLQYDEQTDSINMTVDAMKGYISQSQAMSEAEVEAEYQKQLIKEKNDLMVEQLKLASEYKTMQEEQSGITNGMNDTEYDQFTTMPKWMLTLSGGNADAKASYDELSEAMIENSKQQEENKKAAEDVENQLEQLKEKRSEVSEATENDTQKIEENSAAEENNAAKAAGTAELQEKKAAALNQYADAVALATSNIVKSAYDQISIFGEATNLYGEELQEAKNKTIENMESQAESMKRWASDLETIANNGINKGILEKLANMGPQGAQLVSEFANMTAEEIEKANTAWDDAMRYATDGAISAGNITGQIESAADDIYESWKISGNEAAQGLFDGMEQKSSTVKDLAVQMGENIKKGVNEPLKIKSPSKEMESTGKNVDRGLVNGMNDNKNLVRHTSEQVGSLVVTGIRKKASSSVLQNMGETASRSFAHGIKLGTNAVTKSVREMCEAAISQTRTSLDMHSPSKIFTGFGENSADSFGGGFQNKMRDVQNYVNQSMQFSQSTAASQDTYAGERENAQQINAIESILNGVASVKAGMSHETRETGSINLYLTLGTDTVMRAMQQYGDEYYAINGRCMFNRG